MNIPYNPLESSERPELIIPLDDGTDDIISIIIVHKDQPAYLNICLHSIAATSLNHNYEIIVVDNGSGPESQAFLDEIETEVKVIRNQRNLYWAPAANQGVKIADKNTNYYVFLHSDVVILRPEWIDQLTNVSQHRQSGLVGVEMGHYVYSGQQVDFVQEWCMLMTKECWRDCGPFPESLPQIGHSFAMSMKAQKKGYKPTVIKNSICHHYKTFSLDPSEYERLVDKSYVELNRVIREIQST